eukprot:TRINITY_DN2639_c0_g1_i2.p1 TRINITY_DN2639_c0_g1~~TRINITY_DN2639_c0_g1_i2.p1  ORF type:complete len:497 (+),score=236.07 TRINITY_DN2639_c0_g1_i2:104-1492(+)
MTVKKKEKKEEKEGNKSKEEGIPFVCRLFIGGISQSTKEEELKERLSSFGSVQSIEFKRESHGDKIFGYVNLLVENEKKMLSCFNILNRTTWRGKQFRVEKAKEYYEDRLKREKEIWMKQLKEQEQREEEDQKIKEEKEAFHPEENPDLWVKGKGGRWVAKLNLPSPTGGTMEYNPLNWQRNIKALDEDFEGNSEKKRKNKGRTTEKIEEAIDINQNKSNHTPSVTKESKHSKNKSDLSNKRMRVEEINKDEEEEIEVENNHETERSQIQVDNLHENHSETIENTNEDLPTKKDEEAKEVKKKMRTKKLEEKKAKPEELKLELTQDQIDAEEAAKKEAEEKSKRAIEEKILRLRKEAEEKAKKEESERLRKQEEERKLKEENVQSKDSQTNDANKPKSEAEKPKGEKVEIQEDLVISLNLGAEELPMEIQRRPQRRREQYHSHQYSHIVEPKVSFGFNFGFG